MFDKLRNLRFEDIAKNLPLIIKTPGGVIIWEGVLIIRRKGLPFKSVEDPKRKQYKKTNSIYSWSGFKVCD